MSEKYLLIMKAAGEENNSLNDTVNTVCESQEDLVGTIVGYAMSEDMQDAVREDFEPEDEQDTVLNELEEWEEDEDRLFFILGEDEETDTPGMEVLIIRLS